MQRVQDQARSVQELLLKRRWIRDALKLYELMQQKYKINVYALQVIYLYSSIVPVDEMQYPSVAQHFTKLLQVRISAIFRAISPCNLLLYAGVRP